MTTGLSFWLSGDLSLQAGVSNRVHSLIDRLWPTKGVHSLLATIWRCPQIIGWLAILPASSDAPESPPPTEISMKPDNGKGRRRDDVDPRTFTQRSHFEAWKRKHMTSWGWGLGRERSGVFLPKRADLGQRTLAPLNGWATHGPRERDAGDPHKDKVHKMATCRISHPIPRFTSQPNGMRKGSGPTACGSSPGNARERLSSCHSESSIRLSPPW